MDKVYIICGPTASGKTGISIELAKLIDGEIISADSMQIYREMNIGTARISDEEMQGITHHMLGCVNPDDDYSVALYKTEAEKCITLILSKGKSPIICGGTGLYINSLTHDYDFTKTTADEQLREKLSQRFDEEPLKLYNELAALDAQAAKRIHFNDKKRIIRRLEIIYSGNNTEYDFDKTNSKYDYRIYALGANRARLYERINERVDLMMEQGLLNEAKQLYYKYGGDIKAFAAIGYKEFIPYFNGECDLDKVVYNIKLNTRHYAKRQLTWFKRDSRIKWIDPFSFNTPKEAAEYILNDSKE